MKDETGLAWATKDIPLQHELALSMCSNLKIKLDNFQRC